MIGRIISLAILAARRLLSRPGFALLSLVSIVLAAGLVTSIPLFAQAASLLLMRQELTTGLASPQSALIAVRFRYRPNYDRPLTVAGVRNLEQYAVQLFSGKLGLPVERVVTEIDSPNVSLRTLPDDLSYGEAEAHLGLVYLAVMEGIEEHLTLVAGSPLGEADAVEGLPVWVTEKLCNEMGLNVGERFNLVYGLTGTAIPIHIAGIWRARPGDSYWYRELDSALYDALLVTPSLYEERLEPLFPTHTGDVTTYIVFDEGALVPERAQAYVRALEEAIRLLGEHAPGTTFTTPLEPLQRHAQRVPVLSLFLTIFSLPALGLLFYAFSSISTVAVKSQGEEIAILASRGAGSFLLAALAALEAALLVAMATPLGLLLGRLLARLMGYTSGFLVFGGRQELQISPTAYDRRLLAAALLLLVAARMLPALRAAQESIVTHLRARGRLHSSGVFLKAAVDVAVTATAAYAYWQLRQRGTLTLTGLEPLDNPAHDPLLLLAPALFTLAASLLLVHLFPLLARPVDVLCSGLRCFPVYMGLRQFARQRSQYAGALFLVIVCLGLGSFYASTALSLDTWIRDRIYYHVGADLTLTQVPPSPGGGAPDPYYAALAAQLSVLPASAYEVLPGVEHAARVGSYYVQPRLPGVTGATRFLGIDRIEFPRVTAARDYPGSPPLGEKMNQLGLHEDGLIVPRSLLEAHGLAIGQSLRLGTRDGPREREVTFTIAGTYDSFPTAYPEEENVLIGNLDYFFAQVEDWLPHQVWLKLEPTADSQATLESAREAGLRPVGATADARALLEKELGATDRVALLGVLAIGFLAGSIVSCLGLLVYTNASLQSQLEQVSVLRALGTRVGDALSLVAVEYAGIVGYGLLAGVMVGITTSRLFVPFFRYGGSPTHTVPPFVPLVAWPQIAAMAGAFGGALLLSQLTLLWGITHNNLPATLRMGQRQ